MNMINDEKMFPQCKNDNALMTSKIMMPKQRSKDCRIKKTSTSIPSASSQSEKPTRPLTAYHLYFQLEREYILQSTRGKEDGGLSSRLEDDRPVGKQLDDDMPFRYRYIHLMPYWYKSGSGKRINNGKNQAKRKHRKTHGKISFLDLSKSIAHRWKQLENMDIETKQYVQRIAARELDVYKGEMALFKAATNAEQAVAEKTISSPRVSVVAHTPEYARPLKHVVKSSSEKSLPATAPRSTIPDVQLEIRRTKKAEETTSIPPSNDLDKKNRTREFCFHPVPSSFWKKRKKRAGNGSAAERFPSICYNAPSQIAGNLPSRSFHSPGPRHVTPHSHDVHEGGVATQHRHSSMQYRHSNKATDSYDVGGMSSNLQGIKFDNQVDPFFSPIRGAKVHGRNFSGGTEHASWDDLTMPLPASTMKSSSTPLKCTFSNTVEITLDDAAGLMRALSGVDE